MLKLEPKLYDYMLERLKDNGSFRDAEKKKDFRRVMLMGAESLVGVHEKTGHNDGPIIELIQETYGGHSGESYCAAGMMTCGAFAEIVTGVKFALMQTESTRALWEESPKDLRVKHLPLPGAVAVWADLPLSKWTGHTEIVYAGDESVFYCVGFNTTGTVVPVKVGDHSVNREGNGVYYTVRDYKATASRKLLGFLKPCY